MAFTFNSTPSSPDANSYVSVTEADDYFYAHLDRGFWPSTLQDKQAALVMATNRIDKEKFGGEVTTHNTTNVQRLQWPREWILVRDSDGDTTTLSGLQFRDKTVIPREVKEATFEMALAYLKQQAGENTVDENDLETLSSYQLGPINVSIKDNIKADRLPTRVKTLLLALGPNGWEGNPGIRFTA